MARAWLTTCSQWKFNQDVSKLCWYAVWKFNQDGKSTGPDVYTGQYILYIQGGFLNCSAQMPNFSAKKKNVVQPTRIFCTSRISWNRTSDWLPIVFHFGIGRNNYKNHPVQSFFQLDMTAVATKGDQWYKSSPRFHFLWIVLIFS